MKKAYIILGLAIVFLLSACNSQQPTAENKSGNQNDEGLADQSMICSYLCGRKIPDLCQDRIEQNTNEGINMDDSIYDEASCQLACEAEWNESTIACATDADECAQFLDTDPYCMDDATEEEVPVASNSQGCIKACKNYAKCASYGDDISQKDLEDAFVSCMELCVTWDKTTRDCTANTAINKPGDCAAQTACVLKDVRNLMNSN